MTNQDTKQDLDLRGKIGVKNTPNTIEIHICPDNIKSLRDALFLSMSEFGVKLAQAIDPKRDPFTKQYVSGLERGRFAITKEIEAAYWNLAQGLDHVPTGLGGAVTVTVLCQPGQVDDNTFIPMTAKVRTCAGKHCAVRFLQTHPSQKYHHKDCRIGK